MTSKLPPRTEGFYIFDGLRMSTRPGSVWVVKQPVRIVEIGYGKKKELAVMMLGRSARYRLSTFDGIWTEIEGL